MAPVANIDSEDALTGGRNPMNSYEEFFAWGEAQGLKSDKLIATAFGMTPQTVRNWKAKARNAAPDGGVHTPPKWLSLACLGYEAARRNSGGDVPGLPTISVEWFEVWRRRHGLDTLERTGNAFGLTRQAIHNWFKRESLPHWLPLACIGYEQEAVNNVA
jgi:hypothetical protein